MLHNCIVKLDYINTINLPSPYLCLYEYRRSAAARFTI